MAVSDLSRVCERCAYWARLPLTDAQTEGFGACEQPRLLVYAERGPVPYTSAGLALVSHDDTCLLLTGPWFGCINWTRKLEGAPDGPA